MTDYVRYPIGDQSFKSLRQGGFLYVDKTRYIERLIKGPKYYFLGRPRRFGKSLFLSTLKCFFEGERELFKGLYIDSIDWDWEPYPVILLDLNTQRFQAETDLNQLLDKYLTDLERQYLPEFIPEGNSQRFANIIQTVARKTGKQVVILVDEYDKPLVNNLHDPEQFEFFRSKLAEIYSNFKSQADYIRMVFITGVSRFGKLSVFSDLNNISDISMQRQFAGICGITEFELLENFKEGIKDLGEEFNQTEEEVVAELKKHYDGYHFSSDLTDMYNPYSLLNVFFYRSYENYWVSTGTPSILLEQLKRTDVNLEKLMETSCEAEDLSGLDINNIDPVPLFYQTGYLTIKGYDRLSKIYNLGIPNEEVKGGFLKYIIPAYANLGQEKVGGFIYKFVDEVKNGEVDRFMERLKSMFASTGYDMKMDEERNVQNVLFILFKLVGLQIDAEYKTSDGRIDILLRTKDYVYIMELKYDKTAEDALRQIEEREYSLPWSVDGRKVMAIGINYSSMKRTIDRWVYKLMDKKGA